MDLKGTKLLRNKINKRLTQGVTLFALDLAGVSHVAVDCFQLLIDRRKRMLDYGGDIAIVGASDFVRKEFELAGASHEFHFFTDLNNSMALFGRLSWVGYL